MRTTNQNYQDEYNKWVASLTPKQRAKLEAQGLDKPLDDGNVLNTPNSEVAFATLAGDEFDYSQFDEQPSELLPEADVDAKAKAYGSLLLCWVFQRLQSNSIEKNSTLERDALLFALGLENLLVLKTQTALANHYGITRAGVSARVKAWQKLLGVKPSAMMKSSSACRSYKKARLKNLTRKP